MNFLFYCYGLYVILRLVNNYRGWIYFFVEMIKNDDGDEKWDEEKLDDGFTKAEFEDEEIEDEESKYITEVYVLIFVLVY